MRGAFKKKKKGDKMQTINLFIFLVYHSIDKIFQTEYNDYLANIYSTIPSNYAFILDQDLNVSISKKYSMEIVKITDILDSIIETIKDQKY